MKVLVTGASGFVGSHTVRALLDDGHDVRASARSAERVARALDPLGCAGAVETVEADVTDPEAVGRALGGCDSVINAAGAFSLDVRDGGGLLASNVRATELVLGTACDLEFDPVIHVSSYVAFLPGEGGSVVTPESPVGRSRLPYTRSKVRSEEVARRLQARGFPVATIYPGLVWGPDDPVGGESSTLALDVLAGKFPIGAAGATPVVDVRDLARVHARALRLGGGPRRYIATSELVSTVEIMRLVSEAGGRRPPRGRLPVPVMLGLGRLNDLAQRVIPARLPLSYEGLWILAQARPMDASATVRELGVEFRPAADTIRDAVEWLLEARGDGERQLAGCP